MQFELRKASKSALKMRKFNNRNSQKRGKHKQYWFNADVGSGAADELLSCGIFQRYAPIYLGATDRRVVSGARPAPVAPRPAPNCSWYTSNFPLYDVELLSQIGVAIVGSSRRSR